MHLFEIFYGEIPWSGCRDGRPWLIVEEAADGMLNCFPISGQDYQGDAFRLDVPDPDFEATGLRKTSYIHDAALVSVSPTSLRNRKGVLGGKLLIRFLETSGLSHLLPKTGAADAPPSHP